MFLLVWYGVGTMSKKMSVHFSSASNEWATPQVLFDWIDARFKFTLDPCCTHKSAKCAKHYTQAEDGLQRDWSGERVFMNPPYGRAIGHWVKKAFTESRDGATVVCLIPARTDTKWWWEYCCQASEIIFLTGRVKFECEGKPKGVSAPFPSCFVIFEGKSQGLPKCSWVKLSLDKKTKVR